MSYPETVNLPFNSEIIRDGFVPLRQGDTPPEGAVFWLPLQGGALVVREEVGQLSLMEGKRSDWLKGKREPLCIGTWQGKPLWTMNISRDAAIPAPFVAEPFNAMEERLDDRLLTLGGMAQQILHWDRNSTLCSRCGGPMKPIPGAWGKRCASCDWEHFPHIHPCIIVLVRRGDQFLLARKSVWPKGRYGLVAGFLDFGESLEECVHREVMEETGVRVANLCYVGSQNWPFPSQLMAGFVAEYAGGEIKVDMDELEDARWFCIDEMPELLPGKRSIARWIIDKFALGKG